MCENQTLPSRELEQNPVDGRNPANQLIAVVCSTIHKVLYIPGGCLGFQPSTVGTIQDPLLKVYQPFGETTSRLKGTLQLRYKQRPCQKVLGKKGGWSH